MNISSFEPQQARASALPGRGLRRLAAAMLLACTALALPAPVQADWSHRQQRIGQADSGRHARLHPGPRLDAAAGARLGQAASMEPRFVAGGGHRHFSGGGHPGFVGGFRHRPHFSGGVRHHHRGARFVVVAPFVGWVVPFLPPAYVVWRYGPSVYYRSDDVFYADSPGGGYVVVDPPPNALPAAGEPLVIYPREGQSEAQQSQDRYECHRWANAQTGFDPTLAQGGVSAQVFAERSAAYRSAMGACLEGRGYSVG